MLTLTVELNAGITFETAAQQMQALAQRMDVCVKASFNEVVMVATPGGHATWLATNALARRLKPRPHFNGSWSHHEPTPEDIDLVAEFERRRVAEEQRIFSIEDQAP